MGFWHWITTSGLATLLLTIFLVARFFRARAREARTTRNPGTACDRCGVDAAQEPLDWTYATYLVCRRCATQLTADGHAVSGPPLDEPRVV